MYVYVQKCLKIQIFGRKHDRKMEILVVHFVRYTGLISKQAKNAIITDCISQKAIMKTLKKQHRKIREFFL